MKLLTPICVVVLIVCLVVMVYCIISAIKTAKRNKAKDEISRKIFMAKMQQAQANTSGDAPTKTTKQLWAKEPETIVSSKPKALNYDDYIDDVAQDDAIANGASLKDFFNPN
jgi:hypothetical protein